MSTPTRKTIRTFKERADAEAALATLQARNIHATIEDAQPAPGSNITVTGYRITVAETDAALATNLLLRQTREANALDAKDRAHERDRRQRILPAKRPGFAMIVVFATTIIGCGLAIFYLTKFFTSNRKAGGPNEEKERTWSEDTNRDGKIDVIRYSSIAGVLVREELDTDFDGKMDHKSRFFGGRLRERWRDLDREGTYDEHAFFDERNRLQYVEVDMNSKGPVETRYIYFPADDSVELQEAIIKEAEETGGYPEGAPDENQVILYQAFFDDDADGNFDRQVKYDFRGKEISTRQLPPGAPENRPLPIKPDA